MNAVSRILTACCLPLLLAGCLLVPGKFESSMTVHADRSFTFAYKGEMIASEPGDAMPTPDGDGSGDTEEAASRAKEKADKTRERETKNKAIAAALAKEAGYRSVVYQGNGKFLVDYAIDGKLSTSFVFPFNSDAEVMIPFVAAEVRKDGTVRIKAPGFGKSGSQGAANVPTMGDPSDLAEGSFTLRTDAEIVMHNQEEGVSTAEGHKAVTWTVGALKKDAPTIVLRMKDQAGAGARP